MVGALLTIAVLGQAGGMLDKSYPDQMIGIMPRFGGGVLVGDTKGVTNGLGGWGGSLQIRLTEQIYLDISGDSRIPSDADAPEDIVLLGVETQFVGVRLRQPVAPKSNLVFGAGGGAFAFVEYGGAQAKRLETGPSGYGMAGFERQIYGAEGSGSYIGFEASYTHYFATDEAPMRGGIVEGRVTFSYYFGGTDAADCL